VERVAGGIQHHHRLAASLRKQLDQQNAQLEEVGYYCFHIYFIYLLFVIVMEALSREFRVALPWECFDAVGWVAGIPAGDTIAYQ